MSLAGYRAPIPRRAISAGLAVFARNISDEKKLKGVIKNYMAAIYHEPRIIGVSVSGRYRCARRTPARPTAAPSPWGAFFL